MTTEDELARLQADVAVRRLTEATGRIVDLERELARLRIEREALSDLLRSEAEGLSRTIAQDLFPAARLERIVQAFDIVQRRDIWLSQLSRFSAPESLFALYPHDGAPGSIRILVSGSGGFGDMLYLSSVLRRLYERFDAPYIYVLHAHPDALTVLGRNPYVHAVIDGSRFDHRLLLEPSATLDIFDLVVDARYVISYAAPPLSRIRPETLVLAHSRSADWQRFVRSEWPYLNNALAREASRRGMSLYDLIAFTGDLPSEERQAGDFFEIDPLPPAIAALAGLPFVTIHHGSDRFMAGPSGLQTKNLPLSTLNDVVDRLRASGFVVVQLGEAAEEPIEGADIDLRGATSFAATAAVLKFAAAHLDSEGGLVHLARAVGTRSVVAFGPTSHRFFGYRDNRNIAPKLCGDCWWITRDWALRCARGLPEPECMTSHTAETLVEAVCALAAEDVWSAKRIEAADGTDAVAEHLARLLPVGGRGAALRGSDTALLTMLVDRAAELDVFVDGECFRETYAELDPMARPRPMAIGAVPADRVYDWAVVNMDALSPEAGAMLLFDACRIVKADGAVVVHSAQSIALLEEGLQALPGSRIVMPNGALPATANLALYHMGKGAAPGRQGRWLKAGTALLKRSAAVQQAS